MTFPDCPVGAISNVAMGFNPSDQNVFDVVLSPIGLCRKHRRVKTRRYFGNAPKGQWETQIIPLAQLFTIHYPLLTINYLAMWCLGVIMTSLF
ncbi:MAG: hypothetical protein LBP87_05700 [Planctomycetaceae bacterium]|nr:hypothetical protein [Planctomycetaceae bacterium]